MGIIEFILVFLLALSPGDMQSAVELSRQGDYEASEIIMAGLPKEERCSSQYVFYRAINNYSLNNRVAAEKYVDEIVYSFIEVPIRYKDVALLLKYDMSTWKNGSDDLGDISREMTKIKDRLKNAKAGPKTRKIQKDVENRLKAMIKKIEDSRKIQLVQPKSPEPSPMPAQDSFLPPHEGTGKVDPKIKEIAEVWGKLPEKERAKALVELTRRMPAKDKAVVEAYFKELAKRSKR